MYNFCVKFCQNSIIHAQFGHQRLLQIHHPGTVWVATFVIAQSSMHNFGHQRLLQIHHPGTVWVATFVIAQSPMHNFWYQLLVSVHHPCILFAVCFCLRIHHPCTLFAWTLYPIWCTLPTRNINKQNIKFMKEKWLTGQASVAPPNNCGGVGFVCFVADLFTLYGRR